MPTPSKSKASASLSSAMQVDHQDSVDVTRDNIEEYIPLIEKALSECSFFAFDNE